MKTIAPSTILRRLKIELRVSIETLEHAPRYEREQGQLQALRHVETFLRNQGPVKR